MNIHDSVMSEDGMSNSAARLVAFHEVNKIEGIIIKRSSRRNDWKDIYACIAKVEPFSAILPCVDSLLLLMVHNGQMTGTFEINDVISDFSLQSGSVLLLPLDVPFKMSVSTHATIVSVNISRSLFNDVFLDFSYLSATIINLKSSFPFIDAFLTHSIFSIAKLLTSGGRFSSVEVDYIARTIVARIIGKYSTPISGGVFSDAGLSFTILQKVFDFIDKNLHGRISISEIAPMAGVGAAQFARLFKKSTKETLHQYIIRQRVERARRLLSETDMPIVEVSHECGFADQVHLTKLFGRMIGLSPAAFRKKTKIY